MTRSTIFIFLTLISSVLQSQTLIPPPAGTSITVSPASGTALGNPGGKTIAYSNSNWPSDSINVFAFDKTLFAVINGNNSTPPGGACANMADLSFDTTLSNMSLGRIVYTGHTTYYYQLLNGSFFTNTNVAVRLTIELNDQHGAPLSISGTNGKLSVPANNDFSVFVLLEAYSPTNARYFSGGPGQWTPAITLFDQLHTSPNASICTSFHSGNFLHLYTTGPQPNIIPPQQVGAPAGTIISMHPASGTALGNPGGKTITYHNPNWPGDSCLIFAFEQVTPQVINGNNNAPPGSICNNMDDLSLNSSLSSFQNGILVYRGYTTYRYQQNNGNFFTNSSIPVRLTLSVTDSFGTPLALNSLDGRLYIKADADFKVHALLEAFSPNNARYISGGPNLWTPAITLFDQLHTSINSSICTSLKPGSFYHYTLEVAPGGHGQYSVGDTVELNSNTNHSPTPNTSWLWSGPNGFSANTSYVRIPQVTAAHSGTYYITLTNGYSCSVIDSVKVQVGQPAVIRDTLLIVSDTSWRKSSFTTNATADQYPWRGVEAQLPPGSSFTLPVDTGQPYGWPTMDTLMSTNILKAGSGLSFFRKTFQLQNDSGMVATIQSLMDDGIEIYLNGHLLAREDDRNQSNYSKAAHHLHFASNGSHENGYLAGDSFDFVNNYHLDSIAKSGQNELIVVLRNRSINDAGGFNFKMRIKSGQPVTPIMQGFMVSDINWRQSSVVTPTPAWVSNWSSNGMLPPDSSFSLPVEPGQVYAYEFIQAIPQSFPLKAGENISYYRGKFELVDTAHIEAQLRSTFGMMAEFYLNGHLLARENRINYGHMKLPGHSAYWDSTGLAINGYQSGDAFSQLMNARFDTILRKGENEVTVVLRNKPGSKGGFSFRLDLTQNGSPVIVKKTQAQKSLSGPRDLQLAVFPNPSRGLFSLEINSQTTEAPALLEIFDLQGQRLYSHRFHSLKESESLDIDLTGHCGLFLLRLTMAQQTAVKKLLIN